MIKGHTAHQRRSRLDDLALLGKDLIRRSHAHCELCGTGGNPLTALEVPPLPPRPQVETTIFICQGCDLEMAPDQLNPMYWRFLETAIWSDLAPAQVVAIRLAKQLSRQGEEWATLMLDGLYLDPAIIDWLESS